MTPADTPFYEVMVDLARQSIDDPVARPIFQDALMQLGIVEEMKVHAKTLIRGEWPFKTGGSYEGRARLSYMAWYAAVLFAGWPTEPWELARNCQLSPYRDFFEKLERRPGVYLDALPDYYRVEYDAEWLDDE